MKESQLRENKWGKEIYEIFSHLDTSIDEYQVAKSMILNLLLREHSQALSILEQKRKELINEVRKLKIFGNRLKEFEVGTVQHTLDTGYNNAVDEILFLLTVDKE